MTTQTQLPAESASNQEQGNPFVGRQCGTEDKSLAKLEAQILELERRVDEAIAEDNESASHGEAPTKPEQIRVWGVPFSYLTLAQTLQHIDRLIEHGAPGYFITANLNYNMLTDRNPDLNEVNDNASFIVCDGMPMVWWSKLSGRPLPERVAGSELIYALTKWAAVRGHRVFFLGGAPGIAQKAADKLQDRYPGLQVAGVETPPFRPLTDEEVSELIQRVRDSKADILYVALGQPKGERWMAQNCQKLGVPACVQLGASFDFVAGGVARAPMWIQKIGMEWFYRMAQEPKRLFGRYWSNGLFMLKAMFREVILRKK